MQFCRENNLSQSFAALSAECQVRLQHPRFLPLCSALRRQVSLNTVDSLDTFSADVAAGRWDTMLPQVVLWWCMLLCPCLDTHPAGNPAAAAATQARGAV